MPQLTESEQPPDIGPLLVFLREIKGFDLRNGDAFQSLMLRAQGLLELSDQEIGDTLGVGEKAVKLWMNGMNLPYPTLRQAIADWLEERTLTRIGSTRLGMVFP